MSYAPEGRIPIAADCKAVLIRPPGSPLRCGETPHQMPRVSTTKPKAVVHSNQRRLRCLADLEADTGTSPKESNENEADFRSCVSTIIPFCPSDASLARKGRIPVGSLASGRGGIASVPLYS